MASEDLEVASLNRSPEERAAARTDLTAVGRVLARGFAANLKKMDGRLLRIRGVTFLKFWVNFEKNCLTGFLILIYYILNVNTLRVFLSMKINMIA